MPERIEVPPMPYGDEQAQLNQIWRYLYGMSEVLNRNLQNIGGNELTDREMAAMRGIVDRSVIGNEQSEMATLKDMVIKTAEYVKKAINQYQKTGLSIDVEDGKFGRYVRSTTVEVQEDPEGNTREEPLSDIMQKLKRADISIRSYVYAGVLRTENSTNIYGVAIGKDVVTFRTDGTETFHPENTEMEVLADGIHGNLTGNVTGDVTGDVTGNVTGDLTGNVTGDLTGNVTGDVTGNVTGDLTGNVTGDVTGNVIGDVTGDVTGNVTGDLTGNVTGDVTGNLTGDVTGDVTGDLNGKVLNAETTETDLDDILDAGKYWIDIGNMTGGPSDLLSGECLLEVTEGTNRIQQQISAGDALYIRQSTNGTFGSWYKYAGTAV